MKGNNLMLLLTLAFVGYLIYKKQQPKNTARSASASPGSGVPSQPYVSNSEEPAQGGAQ